ncbi:hypothetical protein EVG20_g5849 [Dentipellis fragilis]|uniref:C3H1-type domain-containing protein n=1 Tax=Dentipellis fragilis TaxID=205917 RepID=A0A4Y9YQM1_9AGAM|nr:hypothetical protein EVG20_g5849 [Dentipellis fragilis]
MASLQALDTAQLLADRKQARAERAQARRQKAESHKEEGNRKFKDRLYGEALKCYQDAVSANGPRVPILSNMAATYLKMGNYEDAENVARRALMQDPLFIKARYRRGLAFKGQKRYKAALIDFLAILEQDPNLPEVKAELNAMRALYEAGRIRLKDEDEDSALDLLPSIEIEYASDSSDYRHEGNGVPCRFYNHAGCTKGRDCPYSHAVNHASVRDDLGKNVCVYFLAGTCKFGERDCVYSHCRDYLPAGRWWDDEENVRVARTVLSTPHAARQIPSAVRHFLQSLDTHVVWSEGKNPDGGKQLEQWARNDLAMTEWMIQAFTDDPSIGLASRGVPSHTRGRGRGSGGSTGRGRGKGRGKKATANGRRGRGHQQAGHQGQGSYGTGTNTVPRWGENMLEFGDDGDVEERMMNHGFTNDEVEELLAQGVKPWDDDARAVLDVLYC